MSRILNDLYIAAGVIFLFGAAIFVHEFGHFWVALWRGMKVEEFAIGFGPKIVAWTRGGIQYSLRWIPAGGFVKLPQMITAEGIEGESKKDEPPPPPAPPFSKILVAFAGPAMNLIFAVLIATFIYFVGLPVAVNPPNIGYVDPKSPEGKLGIQGNDRITAIDGKPVKSWDDIFRTTVLALTNTFNVSIVRGGATNAAGPTNVYALTATTDNTMDYKTLNLDPRDHLVIQQVEDGTPAAAAHVRPNDEIVAFAGSLISSHDEFTNLVQAYGGKKTTLVVKRDNKEVTLEVTPEREAGKPYYILGVMFTSGKEFYDIEHPTPWAQVQDVCEQVYGTITALMHSHESGVKAKDLAGPVGIASMLALQVQSDYRLALHFLVMLNINLAFLNLLPIPVLDGGHIAMAILEKIRRRPLEVRVLEYTTTAFLFLLVFFMLYVTFFDIKRLPLIHSLFGRERQIEQTTQPPAGPARAAQPAR
ncbi:MAG TPA: RIP metalloprotease RseP [Verrucomicrobiae bacterium]|jgi:regulator of sigma E protease